MKFANIMAKSPLLFVVALGVSTALKAQSNTYPFPASGNVGIGTSSPQTTLHLQSSLDYLPQILLDSKGGVGPAYLILQKARTGNTPVLVGDSLGTILANGFANGAYQQASYLSFPIDSPSVGSNVFSSLSFVSRNTDGSTSEKFRVKSNGNVGIGVANPQASLDIWKGYSAGTDSLRFSYYDGTAYWMGIQPYVVAAGNVGYSFRTTNGAVTKNTLALTGDGKVGIGLTNPTASLDVAANGTSTARFGTPDNRTNSTVQVRHSLSTWAESDSGLASVSATDSNFYNNGVSSNWKSVAIVYGGPSAGGTFWGFPNVPAQADSAALLGQSVSKLAIGVNHGSAPILFFNPSGTHMAIAPAGNVGIGTTSPTHKLSVNGSVRAKEVIVETTGWADFVFAPGYTLPTLAETEQHIAEHGHLPGIPSASEVAEQGVSVGDLQMKLLQKLEEMTLHQIALEKRMLAMEKENQVLRSRLSTNTRP